MRHCSLHMVDLCLNYCIQYETVFTAHGRFGESIDETKLRQFFSWRAVTGNI